MDRGERSPLGDTPFRGQPFAHCGGESFVIMVEFRFSWTMTVTPSDELLMHAFYASDNAALEQLAARHDPVLARVAHLNLLARATVMPLALGEWDIDDRLVHLSANRYLIRMTNV